MLKGDCNRCGSCCVERVAGVVYRCVNLIVRGEIGVPNASKCSAYARRFQGMPIVMVSDTGAMLDADMMCAKDSAEEESVIIRKGFGHGCSLTLQE